MQVLLLILVLRSLNGSAGLTARAWCVCAGVANTTCIVLFLLMLILLVPTHYHTLSLSPPLPPSHHPANPLRLFAVGYAARQISTSGQLERLLSNPPVAAGLAISPVDWLAVAPAQITCGGCEQVVMQPQQVGKGSSIRQLDVCCAVALVVGMEAWFTSAKGLLRDFGREKLPTKLAASNLDHSVAYCAFLLSFPVCCVLHAHTVWCCAVLCVLDMVLQELLQQQVPQCCWWL